MAKSQRPRLRELRDIYLLVGECRELGRDPRAWQQHMLNGLNRIFDSRIGICVYGSYYSNQGFQPELNIVDVGWENAAHRENYERYWRDGADADDVGARHKRLPGDIVTCTRQEVMDDREYYRSRAYNDYVRFGRLDQGLLGRFLVKGRDGLNIALFRDVGRPAFAVRDRRLLHLFELELRALMGAGLTVPGSGSTTAVAPVTAQGPTSALPPRLSEVLSLLMHGDSEKQIARKLWISPHTAHFHVKRLHQMLGVSSRGELLAKAWETQQTVPVQA